MGEFTEHAPGTFCWVELATTDTAAAKDFYTELFGWGTNDIPMGPNSFYTMLQIDGKDVAALYELNSEQREQGLPPHWMSYVAVASADSVTEKVEPLGATVLAGPMDVPGAGRVALIQDPTGAALGLWQAGEHIGVQLANEPSTLVWNELATRDVDTAREFYTQLLGWEAHTSDMDGTQYTTFMNGKQPVGGLFETAGENWEGVPPNWMLYFAVEDCQASADRAADLGATIEVPPTDAGDVGRFAVISDPQGAGFCIIAMENPPG
jgi:predicted enzyme related to lactoylglutathione lyase